MTLMEWLPLAVKSIERQIISLFREVSFCADAFRMQPTQSGLVFVNILQVADDFDKTGWGLSASCLFSR